jgi:hypothetical protein
MKNSILKFYKEYPKACWWGLISYLGFLVSFFTANIFLNGLFILSSSCASTVILIFVIKFFLKTINHNRLSENINDDLVYRSVNQSNAVWLIIPFFLLLDFLILIGSNVRNSDIIIVVLPTIIGGGAGALVLWLANKDKVVFITKNQLIIQVSKTEIKRFTKSEIKSYRVSRDGGKTVLRISSNNRNEFELTSYFLSLNGFEEKIKEFLGDENIISNNNGNSNENKYNLDFTEQLLNLSRLKEAGVLTQEEFETEKSKILNSRV